MAGTGLTIFPLLLIGYTAWHVGPTQAAALAAWEQPVFATGEQPAAPPGSGADRVPQSPETVIASAAKQSPTVTGFVLAIPRLGVKRYVPEGASVAQLRRYGVGRITWTSLPDRGGIVGIAGHRTTYGAPFFRLGSLRQGDRIVIDYAGKRFTYSVTERVTVRPNRVDVLQREPGRPGVALVTCTPVYSAAYRLVVLGSLEEVAAIPLERSAP